MNQTDNNKEAHALLALINAEFQSDPMSVQCFDLRIVQRVKECVERQEESRFTRNPSMASTGSLQDG